MKMEFPTKDSFKLWLESKDPGTVISEDWSTCTCPIANFISDTLAETVFISPNIKVWSIYKPGGISIGDDLPDWAISFALILDVDNGTAPATAERCLKILEGV
jgi:hypothetical protein